jgi:hypothetical protein
MQHMRVYLSKSLLYLEALPGDIWLKQPARTRKENGASQQHGRRMNKRNALPAVGTDERVTAVVRGGPIGRQNPNAPAGVRGGDDDGAFRRRGPGRTGGGEAGGRGGRGAVAVFGRHMVAANAVGRSFARVGQVVVGQLPHMPRRRRVGAIAGARAHWSRPRALGQKRNRRHCGQAPVNGVDFCQRHDASNRTRSVKIPLKPDSRNMML